MVNRPKALTYDATSAPQWTGAAAVFLCVWAWFAWPWISGTFTIPWDGKAHFAPQIQFLAASIGRGEWPWWTPNVFAGHPQVSDPQSMLFSPPLVMLAMLNSAPGPWAIDCVVLVMVLFAGSGVLWLARDLGWHPIGALVAAIAFAFGAAMAWRLQHFGQVLSLAYLPLTLLFLRRAIHKPSIGYGVLAGVFAAFIVLGRDQVGLLCIYLLAAYAVALLLHGAKPWMRLRRAFGPLACGALIAGLLVSIPVILTLALAEQSNRPVVAYQDAAAGSLHPALLITGLVPHLFGAAGEMRDYWGPPSFIWEHTGLYLAQNMGVVYLGAVPLLMLIYGVVSGLLWQPGIRYFSVAWILLLLYALGWYTPAYRLMYELLPGVSFYRRPADAVFLLGGIGALLAGYAASQLATKLENGGRLAKRSLLSAIIVTAALFVIAVGFALMFGKLGQAAEPLALAAGWISAAAAIIFIAHWLFPIRPKLAAALIIALVASDLVVNNGPNGASALPAANLAMLEPDARVDTIETLKQLTVASRSSTRRDRIEIIGLGYHWPNTPLTHNLHSTLGANPVRLKHYVEATGAGDTAAEGGQRAFPPLFPSYESPLANLLGLRFIATSGEIEKIDKSQHDQSFKLIAQTSKARIYENPNALPRVLFASRAATADFGRIIRSGRWPTTDFQRTVLIEAPVSDQANRRPGKIAIKSYRNTVVELTVESPDGGWAVLNDVWHPWWHAEVDGQPVPVLKGNVIFRAIEVPAGQHNIKFVFRPLLGAWEQLVKRASKNLRKPMQKLSQ